MCLMCADMVCVDEGQGQLAVPRVTQAVLLSYHSNLMLWYNNVSPPSLNNLHKHTHTPSLPPHSLLLFDPEHCSELPALCWPAAQLYISAVGEHKHTCTQSEEEREVG